jgi:DNA-binding response OmpR family regulator
VRPEHALVAVPIVPGAALPDAAEAVAEQDMALVEWCEEHPAAFAQLCRSLRRAAPLPIVALCRGGRDAWAAALAAGADGALGLPLHLPYLEARRTAWLRARNGNEAEQQENRDADGQALAAGPLRLNLATQQLAAGEQTVALTERETDLLAHFIRHPDRLLSRPDLLRDVWGLDFDPDTNTLDVYVHYLRRKLDALGYDDLIQTRRGRGYRFLPPDPS